MSNGAAQTAPAIQSEPDARSRRLAVPFTALLLLFFVADLGAAFGSFALTGDASRFVSFWPPGGLAVGAMLLADRRRWPALLATAALAIGIFNAWNGQPPAMVLGFAVTNAAEELLAATLAQRLCRGRPDLGKVRHVLALLAVAPFLASFAVGALSSSLLGVELGLPFLKTWVGLWIGAGLGILVMAPVVIAWAEPLERLPRPRRILEGLLLGLLLAGTCALVFGGRAPEILGDEFLLIPAYTWAAIRFGPRGASFSGLLTSVVALWATTHGQGPFAAKLGPASAALATEIYLAVALVTSLLLASVVEERRRGESALRASERSLRLLGFSMDRALDYLSCVGEDGRLVYANETLCRVLARPRAELVGLPVWQLFGDPGPEQWRATWQQVQRSGNCTFEALLTPPGGERLPVEVHSSLVRFGDQDYCINTARDLRERRQAEAAVRMAGVGTLAAGMAHEINNPLACVLGNLSWMHEQLGKVRAELSDDARHPERAHQVEQLQQVIRETEEGAVRVREIVRDLKLFAHAAEEQTSGVADVRRALRGAIGLAQHQLRQRARLVTELGEVPPAAGNEHRLGQVFLNLLLNAAQSIPDGHADENLVRVSAQANAAGEVVVEVEDSGCGLTAEVRNRIFDPFFTTRPVGSGTGLGLAICHGIVSAVGGRIEVESLPGAGSLFRVVLQAAREEAHPALVAPEPPASPRGRVLVLDDDPLVGRVIGRILDGHHVVALTSPRDALERIAREPFDLVLCDLMMPEMTGMEFHAQLAQLRPALAEALIFITGGAFTQPARDFLDRIPNQRIDKPFDPAALREAVGRALSR